MSTPRPRALQLWASPIRVTLVVVMLQIWSAKAYLKVYPGTAQSPVVQLCRTKVNCWDSGSRQGLAQWGRRGQGAALQMKCVGSYLRPVVSEQQPSTAVEQARRPGRRAWGSRLKAAVSSRLTGWRRKGVVKNLKKFRSTAAVVLVSLAFLARMTRRSASAMGIPMPSDGPVTPSPLSPLQRVLIWTVLFIVSSAFHAAETSITTLYPWKVKEFAAEEGERSPFTILDKDITRVLTTILVATTACTIYSAAIFTNLATETFGPSGVAYSTVALTVFTLVFGELIPKSLGVSSAELVARTMVPPINVMAIVLSPVGKVLSMFAKLFLRIIGIKTEDGGRVSEEQLRLLVAGAQKSGGIEKQEGEMISQVLNMQDRKVSEAMCPRVDVEALDKKSTLRDLQELFQKTKYSRIPVYDGEIDKIIGVAMSKDLLEFVFEEDVSILNQTVESIMQPTYFVPETMSLWTCFQEMRQRRVHMAVVVDEYGGTAGVITLEDIQEEVFGEIYDEEDREDDLEREELIKVVEEARVWAVQGNADLDDVCETLDMDLSEEQKGDFATFGGYLCSLAGEIPATSDHIVVPDYIFTIVQADERRIIEVRVERIAKGEDGGDDSDSSDDEGRWGGPGTAHNEVDDDGSDDSFRKRDRLNPEL